MRALTTFVVLAYVASLLLRGEPGFQPFWDVVISTIAHGLCTLAVWGRATRPGADPAVFLALAVGMACNTLSNLVYGVMTWVDAEPPVPSVADLGHLGFVIGVAVALAVELRTAPSLANSEVLLDALMGALGAAAGMVVVAEPLLAGAHGSPPTIGADVVFAVFAVAEILLVAAMVAVLSLPRRATGPNWLWVGVGLGLYVLADLLYALRSTGGQYTFGEPLDGLWLIGLYVIAWGVWLPTRHPTDDGTRRWALGAPLVSLVVAVGVLVMGTFIAVTPVAVVLATSALAIVVVRTALSFRSLRRLADAERRASTDELTGLRNRRSMLDALGVLAQALPRRSQLVVIAFDVDNLKPINDNLGHTAGDAALRLVADAISSSVRPGDLAGRTGGDEFLVVTIHHSDAGSSPEAAGAAMAARIQEAVARGAGMPLRVSVGVAAGPAAGEPLEHLIERADQRMYEDKRRHRRSADS